MSTFGKILKTIMGIVLIFYGSCYIYSSKKRNKRQKTFQSNIMEKKEKNDVIKYLLATNEDVEFGLWILMIIYWLDLIFLK